MKRHDGVIGSRSVLRMMMFSAGVLAVLVLACAGTTAGVGAGTPIQTAAGDTKMLM